MSILKINYRKFFFLLGMVYNFIGSQAQVPVHEEPRHHPVFQNSAVRILDVLIPPGDTTLFHIHQTPSVFIRLTSTAIGSQLQGGVASARKSKAGTIMFENLAAPNIEIHRVWNADKDTFQVIAVELLFNNTGFVENPLAIPDLHLEIDTTWIRAYRLNLSKGKDFKLKEKKESFILVSLHTSNLKIEESGKSRKQTLKPASFFEIKSMQPFYLKNISEDTAEFILLQLPLQ